MNKRRFLNIRNILLIPIFIFVFVHFLKDITQDIFKINTPLDLLGNVNEDLTVFPTLFQKLFYFFGYLSFVAELFLIVAIPLFLTHRLGKWSFLIPVVLVLLVIYLISCVLLDPNFIRTLR